MRWCIISILVCVLACKPTAKAKTAIVAMDQEKIVPERPTTCPEDGQCSWTLMANKTLLLKEDSIGALYPKFEASKTLHVLKFEYIKDTDSKLADGSYKELIFIEIPSTMTSLKLQDETLQQAKVTYGRLCFCRGSSGYFPVKKGRLTVSKSGQNYQVSLSFENGNIPQILTTISGTLLASL